MKNTSSIYIKRTGLFALLLWLSLFGPQGLLAQTQVQVTINVMPPYSAYLQDYAGVGQQIQVIVRNTSLAALDVRLQGRVEGDNGVLIQTLPNFRPNRPLKLMPGETRILTRADLEGSFDLSQISVEGLDKNLLYQGKPLPEGNYQLCVQAFDNRTSQPLSSGFPLGCSPPFSVRIIEPPILISPLCDTDLTPTIPQAMVFTWTPPAGILPTQVSYTLRVIELPLENVDPNVFIDAVALPPSGIEVRNLPTSTFLYGPQNLPLKVGKRYAWRVQAVDRFGKLNLLNDGKSPVCAFRYGQAIAADSLGRGMADYLVFTKPGEPKGKTLPQLSVGYGNPLYMTWGVTSPLANQLTPARKEPGNPEKKPVDLSGQARGALTPMDLTKTNLSYRVRVRALDKAGKPGSVVLDRQVKTPYLSVENADLPAPMLPKGAEKKYLAELELMGLTPQLRKTYGLPAGTIQAEPRRFSLVEKNMGDKSDSIYVKGMLVYNYSGETGESHRMPNTLIALKRVEAGGYENNMGYARTNAQGEFTVAISRREISPTKTIVSDKTISAAVKADGQVTTTAATTKDTTYYNAGYRVVPYNLFLLPAEQTFTISPKQVGTLDAGTIKVLTKGYQVSIAARQAYKNWPGAPDVKLTGKKLVIFRKPNKQVDPELLPVEGQRGSGAATPGSPSPGSKFESEVAKAGYRFVGETTLQADGAAYKASLRRLLYSYNPLDRYAIYCPDCGQKPDDAETFRFELPKAPLSAVLARQESYTFTIQTSEAPTVTFTGKLNYKFADAGVDGAQVKPLANTQVRLQVVYAEKGQNNYTTSIPNFPELVEFHQTISPLLATSVTGKDGSFLFSAKLNGPLPLGELPPTESTKSGELGNASTVYIRALRVVVDNPYYASPSATFGDDATEKIVPQGAYDLGPVTAVARSYTLLTAINSDVTGITGGNQQVGGIKQPLSGINVYVLRTQRPGAFPLQPDTGPPIDEGQSLNETKSFGDGATKRNYMVVAKGASNAEGNVAFPRMVMTPDDYNAYFIGVESNTGGINNYSLTQLKRITTSEEYGDIYKKEGEATQADKDAAKSKYAGKYGTATGDKCYTVWHVSMKHSEGGSSNFDLDERDPSQQELVEGYKKMYLNNPENTAGSTISPETFCNTVKTYWSGQGLRDQKTNVKLLLTGKPITPEFADQYKPFTSDVVRRYLQPGKPSISLRIVDATNPLQGIGQVQITLYNGNKVVKGGWSDNDGRRTFADIPPGINAILTVEKDGYLFNEYRYYDPVKKDTVRIKGGTELKINLGELKLGQNIYIDRVLMQSNTRYIGATLDADALKKNPATTPKPSVKAYVQIDNGMYVPTFWAGSTKAWRFNAYAPGGQADSLKIYPVDISYFNEYRLIKTLGAPKPSTLVSDPKGTMVVDAGDIPIYERDHRILFQLLALDNNKWGPVKDGTVKLFGRDDPDSKFEFSDKDGLLEAKFKNISVENLFVEVSAPDYVTKTVSVTNVESKDSVTQQIFLEPARLIKGVVVAKGADGKETPLPGAEVFVAGGSNAQTPYSTTAGPGGAFTLSVGKQLTSVTVQATYRSTVVMPGGSIKLGEPVSQAVKATDGDTYVGAIEKNYGLPQDKSASLKLTLTPFSKFKIATIWGFPARVESLTALPNGTAKVSGEVELSQSGFGPFGIMDPDVRVRFENVIFKPSAANAAIGEPASVNVPLKTGILDNLGYFSKAYKPGQTPLYNVRLTATGNFLSGGNLQIVRSAPGEPYGVVMAQAQLIDNSFKFSENLLNYEKGQFFLYDPTASGQPGTEPMVVAFRSGGGAVKRTDFGICTKDGKPISMELLAFKATSSLEGSRLKGDEIHLNPTLVCPLKDATPNSLTVNVGDLVLKNNAIDPKSSQTPLTFALANKWSVEVRNWVLDAKQGGFYATEGVVKTGKVDVPISLFNLRADFFNLKAEAIKNLDLAGLAKVDINGKAYFGFDKSTGSDKGGHWALVVVPDGKNRAGVLSSKANLPGLSSDLEFETISLLDNGEDVFSFGASSQLVNYYNGVMDIRPKAIETGADYFAFDAGMSTGIPNAPKDVPMRLTYYRPAGNGPVTLKTIVTGDYIIDTNGQVQFVAGQDVAKDGGQKTAFYFADGIMAIRGMAREKDKLQLGQPGNAGVVLVHSTLNGGYTYLTHDRKLDLNTVQGMNKLTKTLDKETDYKHLSIALGGKTFGTVYCNQTVMNKQWGLLTFSGIPKAFTMIPEEEKNRLTFTNYGSIRAENQKLTADGIGGSNGFPGMTLEYDMAKSRFTGTVTLPPNMPLPPTMTVEQGVAQIRIDGSGFYLAASATVRDVPLIVPVTMKAGLMLGYYDSSDFTDAGPVLFSNVHRKALPCAFKQTFKGVFVTGEIPIPIIDEFNYEKSFVFGSIKTGMTAYVDGYVFGNYENKILTFGTGVGAEAKFYAYGSIANVSAGGEINITNAAQFDLTYETDIKKITMDAKMNMGAEFKAAVHVDLGVDSYDTSGGVGFCARMNYPQLAYTIGGNLGLKPPSFEFTTKKCNGDCPQ